MRVHERAPDDVHLLDAMDRELDPGEFEISTLSKPYRDFILQGARRYPKLLFDRIQQRRPTDILDKLLVSLVGYIISRDDADLLDHIYDQLDNDRAKRITENLGRSTMRYLVRHPYMRRIKSLPRTETLLGEMALNANTLYRQGTDVLHFLLSSIDDILGNVEYVNVGEQQLFNTNRVNLLPGGVYPTTSYGVSELEFPLNDSKLTWLHTPPGHNTFKDLVELYGMGAKDLRVNPVGFLPKHRYGTIKISPEGLRNKSSLIPRDKINKILAGFIIRNKQNDTMFIPPVFGKQTLSVTDSILRKKIFNATSQRNIDITKQIKEKGSAGYGDQEIDIYNEGQFYWDGGKRRPGEEDDIIKALFPHPLIRLVSTAYRDDNITTTCRDNICGLTLATLPLVQK